MKNQFEAMSKDQLFNLCFDFFTFTWNPKEDVSSDIAKLKTIWDKSNGLKRIYGLDYFAIYIFFFPLRKVLPFSIFRIQDIFET